MSAFALVRVHELDFDSLAPIVAAADEEGHRFVQSLIEDWRSGANRFDRGAAEAYFSLRDGPRWVAVGGLNVDPRAGDPRTGRVRHFFVLPAFRSAGCGAQLLAAVIEHARPHFDRLLLHTERAGRFYERHGFVRFDDERTHSTHALTLR